MRRTFFEEKHFYRPCSKNVPYFGIIDSKNNLVEKGDSLITERISFFVKVDFYMIRVTFGGMGRGFSTIFTFKTLAKYFQVQTVPSGIFRFFSAAAKNGNAL